MLQDLTIEQFQQKAARSLEEVPGVRISKSYASVRSQVVVSNCDIDVKRCSKNVPNSN